MSTWLNKEVWLVSLWENFAEVEIFELQMRTGRKIFFVVLFYSFHHTAHVPCEKFRWRQAKSVSGNQALRMLMEDGPFHNWKIFHVFGKSTVCWHIVNHTKSLISMQVIEPWLSSENLSLRKCRLHDLQMEIRFLPLLLISVSDFDIGVWKLWVWHVEFSDN